MCDSRFKHTMGKTARILAVSSFVLAAVVLHPSYQAVQFKSGLSSPVTSRYNVQPSKTHIYREESSFATNLNAKSKDYTPCLSALSARPRALVTGVSGMIGSYVVKQLIQEGKYEVHGLVRYRSDLSNLAGELNNIQLVRGDILDGARVKQVVAEICPTVIFHFAAQAINGVSYDSAELTLDTNIKGTFNMLEAVRFAGLSNKTRFLLAGSSTEYGKTADTWEGAIPEEAPLAPVSPYGVSKVAADLLAQQYVHSHGMHVVTARFFIQVSAGGTESLAPQEFCRQIAMIELGLQSPVVRHGRITTKRDITDLRDSARVVTKLVDLGEPGESYNIGSGIALSMKDILDTAISLSTRPDITTLFDGARERLYDEKILLSDNRKIRELTGWIPDPNITNTIADILKHWRRKTRTLFPE
jgi:GDP-4-dehydro-6-deoxy-D-mannose reductase